MARNAGDLGVFDLKFRAVYRKLVLGTKKLKLSVNEARTCVLLPCAPSFIIPPMKKGTRLLVWPPGRSALLDANSIEIDSFLMIQVKLELVNSL